MAFVGDPQVDDATQLGYARASIYRELRERKDAVKERRHKRVEKERERKKRQRKNRQAAVAEAPSPETLAAVIPEGAEAAAAPAAPGKRRRRYYHAGKGKKTKAQ